MLVGELSEGPGLHTARALYDRCANTVRVVAAQVFCSRRACMAKLRGPGAPQTIEEFRLWKSVIESGQVFFVCPHCIDQGECQGPQCKKRIKSKTGDAHSGMARTSDGGLALSLIHR